MSQEHDMAVWRVWALENAIKRNQYASTDRVIAEAERFSQFIERRADAQIYAINIDKATTNDRR